MNKSDLRQQFLQKRKALSPAEVNRRSELITAHFFEFLGRNKLANAPGTIHTFLPIQRQNEVDTWLIIHGLWESYYHLNVAVSVTDVSENILRHYSLFPQTMLIENRWGIPEPVSNDLHPQLPGDFDIVLVPLLAFDQQGQRIGYGGGYYDRFLAECRPDCIKVGLSLFEPIERIDNIELTDVRLNICITSQQIYVFK